MALPEWALKYKTKGTEIRFIKGKYYYLYKISSKWDKMKKRAVKVTEKYLGRIDEKAGLIPPGERAAKNKPKASIQTKEFGATQALSYLGHDIIKALEDCFPDDWNTIYSLALMKLLHQTPLKNMEFWFESSYLSVLYPSLHLSKNALTSFMRIIGSQENAMLAFKKKFMAGSEYTIVDVTDIVSHSNKMTINHVGYSSEKHFQPQVNFLYFYSVDKKMPGYYRILPGNISGIKALKLAIDEAQLEKCTVIGDKGFCSEENVKNLEDAKLNYVLPYRRNSTYADYSRLEFRAHEKAFDGHFMHHARPISHYSYTHEGRRCIMFFDEILAAQESSSYLVRQHESKEGYSMEEYRQLRLKFGTMLLVTNFADAAPAQVYELYKSRMEIETLFDALKNTLDADTSYMQSNESFHAWAFLNHIALLLYYRLTELLRNADLLQKHSPKDLLERLSEIRKVSINGRWRTTEITTKTEVLLSKLGIPIV